MGFLIIIILLLLIVIKPSIYVFLSNVILVYKTLNIHLISGILTKKNQMLFYSRTIPNYASHYSDIKEEGLIGDDMFK